MRKFANLFLLIIYLNTTFDLRNENTALQRW